MSKRYRHIKEHEKEILKLKEQGLTKREIGEKLGFSIEQIHNFISRHNKQQRKSAAEIALKRKGRPRKDGNELPPSIQQLSRVTQLQYELESQKRYIKRLEMENELMRDFLSLTERK